MLSQQGGTFRAVERGPGPGLDAARGLASKIQKYLLRSAKEEPELFQGADLSKVIIAGIGDIRDLPDCRDGGLKFEKI